MQLICPFVFQLAIGVSIQSYQNIYSCTYQIFNFGISSIKIGFLVFFNMFL